MNLWSHILVSVGAAAAAVLTAFLATLIHKTAGFVAARLEHLRSSALRDALEAADQEAQRLSLTFATALNQSVVNDLKKNGGWTPVTAAEVKSRALSLLHDALSKPSLKTLEAVRAELEGLLSAYVEDAVARAPNRVHPSAPSPPEPSV